MKQLSTYTTGTAAYHLRPMILRDWCLGLIVKHKSNL
jgi:hypothetical protein